MTTEQILTALGLEDVNPGGFAGEWMASGELLDIPSPIDGTHIASVRQVTEEEYDRIVDAGARGVPGVAHGAGAQAR